METGGRKYVVAMDGMRLVRVPGFLLFRPAPCDECMVQEDKAVYEHLATPCNQLEVAHD